MDIPPPQFSDERTGSHVDPIRAEMAKQQNALLGKMLAIVLPIILGGAVTTYLQVDRNNAEITRLRDDIEEHRGNRGHDETRESLSEIVAELRAMRREAEGSQAIADARWEEINRRLETIERRRERTRITTR